ncbi:MAG: serine/threonine protein kinase [Planctomycetota bacterium]|nr:serine/threonine protein kinase [Planctomycetota bacterium]
MDEVFTDEPLGAPTPGPTGSARFGDVAVEMGLLTQEQVRELLKQQKSDRDEGFPKRLDEIAIELNLLARVECDLVLKELRRRREANRDSVAHLPGELVVPCQLGALEVEQRLVGPLGTIYRAFDKGRGKDVAVKVVPPALAADQGWWDRVKFEARVASRLSHPNMIAVYAADEVDGRRVVVMDHVEGEPLINRVTAAGLLNEREALRYGRGLAFALYHAHVVGLLYRDVQPSMAVIDRAGICRLYGLGLAKFYTEDHEIAESGLAIANPFYLAPELLAGDDAAGPAADLYGLGATLFHLLCGHPPYEGAPEEVKEMHRSAPIPDPADFVPQVSKYTRGMVMKLLAKDPADRYEGADHVAGAIDKLLEPPRIHTGIVPPAAKEAPEDLEPLDEER